MTNPISRRAFLGSAAAAPLIAQDLPRVDYHAHIDAAGTLEKALAISKERAVKFGIVEHAGSKADPANTYAALIHNDATLQAFLDKLEGKPVYKGIQAEGIDWPSCFSKNLVARLDYVLTDALTLPDKNGRHIKLWTPAAQPEDKREFMDRYVAFHVEIMRREPIDILANPTFLPAWLNPEFDAVWTPARMTAIIDAAVKYKVAIEMNTRYRLPRPAFLKLAKRAGARFSFGSNIHGPDVGKIDYGLEMSRELGLTRKDLFSPAAAGRKPVRAAGSKQLFNGRDLTGWARIPRHEGAPADQKPGLVVQNGLLVSVPDAPEDDLWYTPEKIGNATLRIVYKVSDKTANSGIFLRIPIQPNSEDDAINKGIEVQIDDSGDDWHCTGVLYSMTQAKARPSKPPGEWNTLEIALKGPRTIVKLNGVLVTDYDGVSPVPPKKGRYEPERGPRPDQGYIAIQHHGGGATVWFKEIALVK